MNVTNINDPWAKAAEQKPQPAKLDEPIPEALQERLKQEGLSVTPDGILMLWQKSQKILALAKEDEMTIRKTAVKVWVPKPSEGVNSVDLGSGYVLKAKISYNYNLNTDNSKIETALNDIAALGNEGPFVADRLVSWKASFLLTEYRKLQDDATNGSEFAKKALNIINSILTITDASPTLEIKEPKKK